MAQISVGQTCMVVYTVTRNTALYLTIWHQKIQKGELIAPGQDVREIALIQTTDYTNRSIGLYHCRNTARAPQST